MTQQNFKFNVFFSSFSPSLYPFFYKKKFQFSKKGKTFLDNQILLVKIKKKLVVFMQFHIEH